MSNITILTLLILSLSIRYSKGETIPCDAKNTGSCQCSNSISGETCTLDCSSEDICQGGKLKCRTGDNCIIDCKGKAACNDAKIDAAGAIDVTVICGQEDSCKGNTEIECGTGVCSIECSDETACEDTTIDATDASKFICAPSDNCRYAAQINTAAPSVQSAPAAYEIQRGVDETLIEPPIIDLTYDGASLILYTRLCKYSVRDSAGLLYIRMTRYCYCTDEFDDSSCSIPGPTLLTKGNTHITIAQVNQLTGAKSTSDMFYHNKFKDMDSTNIHTHGIHVSPFQDDTLITIEPGKTYTHTYTYGFHYPGTHWYHAHHHGSVAYQVDAGLHGAQIMTSDDPLEQDLEIYEENILIFNWQYPLRKTDCIGINSDRGGSSSLICPGINTASINNPIPTVGQRNIELYPDSMCDLYCSMPTFQLDASEFAYDIETELGDVINAAGNRQKPLLFFVNGQISPRIDDLEVGIYRRLRLINSLSIWTIQFKFPDECEWYLIAQDGIYLDGTNMNYDLSAASHQNELLLATGGRADVMVKCNSAGTYDIIASENNNLDPQLAALMRVPNGELLFSIVVKRQVQITNYFGIDALPTQYSEKPMDSYVEDTINTATAECDCNRPMGNGMNNKCKFEFTQDVTTTGEIINRGVNNKPFDLSNSQAPLHLEDSLSVIRYDKLYEFTINNFNGHIYHQHTNPFQFTANVGQNGFIALAGTWSDTFGNDGNIQNVIVNSWTRDYHGLIVVHCHSLEHEDTGMMSHFNILAKEQYMCPWTNVNNANGQSDVNDASENNHKDEETYNWLSSIGLTPEIGVLLIVAILLLMCVMLVYISIICYRCKHVNRPRKGDLIAVNSAESDGELQSEDGLELVEVHTETK